MQILILILSCLWAVFADPSLSIMLMHLENPQGVLADGKPCSSYSFIGVQCTMEMSVCVILGGADNETHCFDLGQVSTGSNEVDFTETTLKDWKNPTVLPMSSNSAYEGFSLNVTITSHGSPVDSWTAVFSDGSQLRGFNTHTSSRGDFLGTSLTAAWNAIDIQKPTAPPTTTTTIATTYTGTTTEPPTATPTYPKDCDEVTDKQDGVKTIYFGENHVAVDVYCQFGTNGAYTVIQSRGDSDNTLFNRTVDEYKTQFGQAGKGNNFWLGLDNMVALTGNGGYDLLIELCCNEKLVAQQFYQHFNITGEKYTMQATAADTPTIGLDYISMDTGKKDIGQDFATYSSMTEDARDVCEVLRYYSDETNPIVNEQTGGWWFGSCGNHLNGQFVPSTGSCKLKDDFPEHTTGIEMRTTGGQFGPDQRSFDGVSYDRVRMAVYKTGQVPLGISSFCS